MLVLTMIGVLIPLVIAVTSGNLDISHNDDFAHRRAALELFTNHRLAGDGWFGMTLIGLVLWAQPFLLATAGAPWALGLATAVLATLGIAAAYALLRSVPQVSNPGLAVLGLVLFPGFAAYTSTFMTDVPTVAGTLISLAFGAVSSRRSAPRASSPGGSTRSRSC